MASQQGWDPSKLRPAKGQEKLLAQDAAALRNVLDLETVDRTERFPVLVALCGLPGTGKSHFARELTKRVPMLVLETDRLRKILVPSPRYTPEEHRRVFLACYTLLQEYLSQGQWVLFDATNLTEDFRKPIYYIAEQNRSRLVLAGFTAPKNLIRQRLTARSNGDDPLGYSDATWLVHSRMRPFEEPILRTHLLVDSSQDITALLGQAMKQMTSEP